MNLVPPEVREWEHSTASTDAFATHPLRLLRAACLPSNGTSLGSSRRGVLSAAEMLHAVFHLQSCSRAMRRVAYAGHRRQTECAVQLECPCKKVRYEHKEA